MATIKNITMKQFNGTDYDTLYPKTKAEQVEGIYSKQEVLSDSTKELYGLRATATPNDVFTKLAMPHGYYGFNVTTVLSDGTPVPFVTLNGLQDISGNTAITDENGRCPVAMIDSKAPTITISDYIGVVDKEVTITAEEDVVFTPITITLERDTSIHLIETSQTLKVLMGVPVDMCIVGGGASGIFRTTNGDFPGGGGGYVTNILGTILTNPNVTLVVGSGGPRDLNNGNYGAGGDTSIEYNGIVATAEGAKNQTGNGNGGNGDSIGQDGTIHVFNDESLPLPGGGGGGGNRGDGKPGGSDFGGHGASQWGSSSHENATSGTGPGGGGGGGARSGPYDYAYSAGGHAGGLYIRVNAPEVSA